MHQKHAHTPSHFFADNTPYFITGAIYRKRKLLASSEIKERLLELIREQFENYDWRLQHWVILDNHYHLMGVSEKGCDLSAIFRKIHSLSGIEIRGATGCETPVWWNYWDYCPRNETDYRTRLNYLFYNPIKHGYVADLKDYPFSSFHETLTEIGRADMERQFRKYAGYRSLVLNEAKDDDF